MITFKGKLAVTALAATMAATSVAANEVNLYSARHYDSDQAIYEAFTKETGIEVNLIEGKSDALIERIKREGVASPADILVTVDAGNLWRADQEGVFQPVNSETLNSRLPDSLRHPDGHWFGFSQRLRVIYYDRSEFDPTQISEYEDLAKPEFEGEVCIRSSSNIYNQSLLASMIEYHGEDGAEEWAQGVVNNMARDPQGGDTDQIRAVAAGECNLAVGNHYYYARLLNSDDEADREVARKVGIIFPNQSGRGVHANIGGAGVVATAPNRENAVRFLEFLASDTAQEVFARSNHEFPAVDGVLKNPVLDSWGNLNIDDINVSVLGENNPEAVRIFDRVGWR
ncbi:Fe(3+) ABC transporter substrate-binding protein [Marinobacter vulgaris]|uniref:Fe(3+) ABC transporter substrate-binding protein n=1 Tax=Marinobacter vulgaris TaxID=1928331 RepID=A0A2V3ZRQ0_9GAMM|nr:Fe(3+) ABC transporter substrate-binding protein [Marinobacter vulgaris]PXX92560.1 Fe(3+) ABC transporter substrate-binding protein [Marinobacter vulgaris]TSJ71496.1 Fe(3+) ABC transporter substrate-binding protein [Marinobacter vulgaris]